MRCFGTIKTHISHQVGILLKSVDYEEVINFKTTKTIRLMIRLFSYLFKVVPCLLKKIPIDGKIMKWRLGIHPGPIGTLSIELDN